MSSQSVSVSTVVNPPYSPYLSDYTNLKDRTVITLINNENNTKQVYLKARFYNNNGFIAQTIEEYRPVNPIFLNPNVTYQLPANEELYSFFNEENVEVNNGDIDISDLLADGILPEGNYSLCIDIYDFNTDQQLNIPSIGCGMVQIQYLNAPQLLFPSCENGQEPLKQPQSYSFSWSPVMHNSPILYNLYIVKLEDGDVPQDVIENAIDNGGNNVSIVQNISTNSLNYNMQHPALTEGNYAWAVVARVANGNYPIVNNGLSNVCTFSLSNMNQQNNQNFAANENIECSCKIPLPDGLSNANDLTVGTIVKTSHFDMEIVSFQKNGNQYSGVGHIPLPLVNASLIKAKVVFTDIEIKKSGNDFIHTAGIIKANVHQSATPFLPQPDINDPGGVSLGQNEMSNLSDFIKNNADQKMSWIKNAGNSFAFSVPIGLDEKAISIIITDITFEPDQGYFQAAAVVDMLDANSKFALLAKGICIDKNDFCGDVKLMLAKSFEVPVIGFTMLGGINDSKATSITFDKNGFKNLHIGAKYTFPAGSLVDKSTNGPASVMMQSDTEKGWSDWVADVEFSTFYISGFDEFSFGPDKNGTKMFYDHSDVRNPQNIPSPYASTDPSEAPIATNLMTWRGFYIPAIQINLPGYFNNATNNTPTTVLAENLIFDGGLSGNVSVNNILAIEEGSLDSWYFSIDQFKIDLWKSSFKSSSLNGKIVLPLSHDYANTSNQLDYTCTLSKPANQDLGFSFVITPKADLAFDIFWAKSRLTNGTNVTIQKRGGRDFLAKAALFGSLTIIPEIKGIPNIKLAEIKFQNMRIQSQSEYFAYDDIQFALASPQHSIAGFSIDLDPTKERGVSLDVSGIAKGEIGLKFQALLKLVADVDFVPKAEVGFRVYGKMELKNGRPNWEGIGAEITKITFGAEAKIGPVGVDGTIAYFNDNNGSYGFMGGLAINVDPIIKVEAKAQFGYKSEGDDGYNYFFIDALAESPGGLIHSPPVAVYGFMGGVFFNMEQEMINNDPNNINKTVKYVHDPNNVEPFVSLSGQKYTPKKGLFEIRAGVLFGLETRSILDADGSLIVKINYQYGGVELVAFDLNGRFVTDISKTLAERKVSSMGIANVYVEMNFVEASFLFHAAVKLGVPSSGSPDFLFAQGHIDFYKGPTGWFVHVGRPWHVGESIQLQINVPIGKLDFTGYFQCGSGTGKIKNGGQTISGINGIDPMPPIPQFIYDIINRGNNSNENGQTHSASIGELSARTQRGNIDGGLAFGANFEANIDIRYVIFYLKAHFMAGFDLAFINLIGNPKCSSENGNYSLGASGYYAEGQAYLGATVDIGIEIDLFFFSGKFSIAEAGIGAVVEFGSPNPTYLDGTVGGYFSILGGIVEGSFAIKMSIGEKCRPVDDESIPLIAHVVPEAKFDESNYKKPVNANDLQEIYLSPSVTFNYLVDETFLIVVPSTDGDGNSYRQYRYYHILPENINIRLGGGLITQNGDPVPSALKKDYFKVSIDGYTYLLKEPISFTKNTDYTFDVDATVNIYNLREASKNVGGVSSGYKSDHEMKGVPDDRRIATNNTWSKAEDKNGDVYVDERHVMFKTNCGISKIEEAWITNIDPFHRTQNNPISLGKDPTYKNLKEAKSDKINYTTSFYQGNKSEKVVNSNPFLKMDHALSGRDLLLSINGDFFDENKICIPKDFEKNSDFYLKISSFDKKASGASFQNSLVKADISPDKKSIRATLTNELPKNSYVVVHVLMKRRPNPIDNNKSLSSLVTKKAFVMEGAVTNINYRTVPLESKLAPSGSEFELFRWYFTTGDFETYRDKFAAMDITADTFRTIHREMFGSKVGFKTIDWDVTKTTFNFLGKERFDFHDIDDHNLAMVFPSGKGSPNFPMTLGDGFLGFAFDNKSQELVNQFLTTYYDPEVLPKNEIESTTPYLKLMEEYITDKMFDATKWDLVSKQTNKILPALMYLPQDLSFGSNPNAMNMDFSKLLKQNELLFSIERVSRYHKKLGSKRKDFPYHILGMKDLLDGIGGNDPVVIFSHFADSIENFNNNIMNNVASGFKPQILNNKNL